MKEIRSGRTSRRTDFLKIFEKNRYALRMMISLAEKESGEIHGS